MSPEPPSTVVFDLGNVIVGWDPWGPFAGVADRAEVDEFFREVDFPAFNRLQDAGRPWAEARREVARRLPHRAWLVDRYVSHFALALTGPVPGTEAVLRALARSGIRLLGLTNFSAETYHHAPVAAPAIGLLEAVVVSGREGVAKPDRKIYDLLIERFRLEPPRTVFVDDSPANVVAARTAGLIGIHFTDADGLVRDLVALGVGGVEHLLPAP